MLEHLIYDKIINCALLIRLVLHNLAFLKIVHVYSNYCWVTFTRLSIVNPGYILIDAIYLNLFMVFDLVLHMELLYKLHLFGITGNLWGRFQQHLVKGYQCVDNNYFPVATHYIFDYLH